MVQYRMAQDGAHAFGGLSMSAVLPFDAAALPAAADGVIHLVGPVTDVVFSFLGPTTAALAEQGMHQTVILVDEPAHRHLLPLFHPAVRLVLTPGGRGPVNRMMLAWSALRTAVDDQPSAVVHLHGLIPSMAGVMAVRLGGIAAPLYFSPHGSRGLGPLKLMGTPLLWALRPLAAGRQRSIASASTDAALLRSFSGGQVKVVESAVDERFFDVARHEARQPLLVTSSRTRHAGNAAALFAQLAVLLSEESLQLGCNWLGTTDSESAARLSAAGVGIYDAATPQDRATRLASGWVYVAFDGALGFPVFLAEAMAAGLPCVAWDTPYHRDVIRHGVTGLLCRSREQLLAYVAELIDSADLRRQLGEAARQEARQRFDAHALRRSMMAAYGTSTNGVD
ncbi:glycosyltransferase [Aquincola sp. J276]|uniref:glycosyltransferase n=1 Tax=Aquincola sp. J276 TaxID=2898432 RepID=UPI002150E404|nr:glycosyltransferase [Aquincola sp. J276]MCR5868791.1 glycosyltransferase [Aquincola sp. J276]